MNKKLLRYLCLSCVWMKESIRTDCNVDEELEYKIKQSNRLLSRRQRKKVNRSLQNNIEINTALKLSMPRISHLVSILKETPFDLYSLYVRINQYTQFRYLIKKNIDTPSVFRNLELEPQYLSSFLQERTLFNQNRPIINAILEAINIRPLDI